MVSSRQQTSFEQALPQPMEIDIPACIKKEKGKQCFIFSHYCGQGGGNTECIVSLCGVTVKLNFVSILCLDTTKIVMHGISERNLRQGLHQVRKSLFPLKQVRALFPLPSWKLPHHMREHSYLTPPRQQGCYAGLSILLTRGQHGADLT